MPMHFQGFHAFQLQSTVCQYQYNALTEPSVSMDVDKYFFTGKGTNMKKDWRKSGDLW
jgi:hypothetical protein